MEQLPAHHMNKTKLNTEYNINTKYNVNKVQDQKAYAQEEALKTNIVFRMSDVLRGPKSHDLMCHLLEDVARHGCPAGFSVCICFSLLHTTIQFLVHTRRI